MSVSASCRSARGRRCPRRLWLRSKVDLVTLIPRRDRGHETSRLCLAMPGDGVGCCGSALRLHGGTKLQAARGHHACGLAKRPGAARLARRSRMVGHFPGPGAPRATQHRRRGQPRRPGRGGASPRVARTARSRARRPVPPGQCRRQLPVHAPELGEQPLPERLEGPLPLHRRRLRDQRRPRLRAGPVGAAAAGHPGGPRGAAGPRGEPTRRTHHAGVRWRSGGPQPAPAGPRARELPAHRPDIRRAEQTRVAANARIGVEKAEYFQKTPLTGVWGVESVSLSALFTGGSRFWSIGPAMTVPLFTAGRIKNTVKGFEARQQQAALQYLQTIQQAFREVEDALVSHRKVRDIRAERERRVTANRRALSMVTLRYERGLSTQLEVLDIQRELFSAELAFASATRDQLTAVVQLYRALGGGWQSQPPAGHSPSP